MCLLVHIYEFYELIRLAMPYFIFEALTYKTKSRDYFIEIAEKYQIVSTKENIEEFDDNLG